MQDNALSVNSSSLSKCESVNSNEFPIDDLKVLKSKKGKSNKICKSNDKSKLNGKRKEVEMQKKNNENLVNKSSERNTKKGKRKSKEKRKSRSFTRRLWGDNEDKAIAILVKEYGIKKWTLISKKLQEEYQIHGRSGKQCRER